MIPYPNGASHLKHPQKSGRSYGFRLPKRFFMEQADASSSETWCPIPGQRNERPVSPVETKPGSILMQAAVSALTRQARAVWLRLS